MEVDHDLEATSSLTLENTVSYNCNNCREIITSTYWYHCNICVDYDLCNPCFQNFGHPHLMDPFINENVPVAPVPPQPSTSRAASAYLRGPNAPNDSASSRLLVHVVQCKRSGELCLNGSCRKLRRQIKHAKRCRRREHCIVCKDLQHLVCCHAKHCTLQPCPVPACKIVKQTLNQRRANRTQNLQGILAGQLENLTL